MHAFYGRATGAPISMILAISVCSGEILPNGKAQQQWTESLSVTILHELSTKISKLAQIDDRPNRRTRGEVKNSKLFSIYQHGNTVAGSILGCHIFRIAPIICFHAENMRSSDLSLSIWYLIGIDGIICGFTEPFDDNPIQIVSIAFDA